MDSLWSLFIIFLKIGAFTFGGGYSMIPIMQHELGEKHQVMEREALSDALILAQTLPGVLAVNAATLIGYQLHKKRGAIVCALGVVLPSFLIIVLLANVILKFGHYPYVVKAFEAIGAVVVGMIVAAAIKLAKPCLNDTIQLVLIVVTFLLSVLVQIHPIILIIFGGVIGCILSRMRSKEKAGV